jgi:hypothetical protein
VIGNGRKFSGRKTLPLNFCETARICLHYSGKRRIIKVFQYILREVLMNMGLDWMTAQEAGEQWGITTRRVQVLCMSGRVTGATRLGKVWIIPKSTPKPTDGRTKAAMQFKK